MGKRNNSILVNKTVSEIVPHSSSMSPRNSVAYLQWIHVVGSLRSYRLAIRMIRQILCNFICLLGPHHECRLAYFRGLLGKKPKMMTYDHSCAERD